MITILNYKRLAGEATTAPCGFRRLLWARLQPDSCEAMLQTPHHFFSPDPFERNLGTFKRVPNEGNLFYGLIQDGNDLWNSALFCGSCAVLRRGPLEEVGGIAVETVTEDAHTALKMHRRGYTTAYLREVLAGGLATESLSSHIGQRIRWARGMAQIFRLDNPFLGKGLNFFQRLCYSNAMLHFFSGIPRLVFLTAPLAYLFFEFHIINASAVGLEVWAAVPFRTCPGRSNSGIKQAFVTDTCSTADCTPWTACVDSISTQTGTTPCSHCA